MDFFVFFHGADDGSRKTQICADGYINFPDEDGKCHTNGNDNVNNRIVKAVGYIRSGKEFRVDNTYNQEKGNQEKDTG